MAKKKSTGIPLYFHVFELGRIAFGPKKQLDLKTRLKLQLVQTICIWTEVSGHLPHSGTAGKYSMASLNLNIKLAIFPTFSASDSVNDTHHQLVVPFLEHLGDLLVVVVGAGLSHHLMLLSLALASWALLAGSCLLLDWVGKCWNSFPQSSGPLSWKYKNYFSCQTSTNAHIQFLTCCGIRKSAKQFLWVENSLSYAQMSFRIGKRTNFIATATANANNLPWQTDWQSPDLRAISSTPLIISSSVNMKGEVWSRLSLVGKRRHHSELSWIFWVLARWGQPFWVDFISENERY